MVNPLVIGVDPIARAKVEVVARRAGVEITSAGVQDAMTHHSNARLVILAGDMLCAVAAYGGRPRGWQRLVLVLVPGAGEALDDEGWRLVGQLGVEQIVPLPYGAHVLAELLQRA